MKKSQAYLVFGVFIVSNLLIILAIIISAVTNFNIGVRENTYTVFEVDQEGKEIELKNIKNPIKSTRNFIIKSEKLTIYAISNSEVTLNNNSIELLNGTIYIDGENLELKNGNSRFSLQNKFNIIFDKEDNIIITGGEPAFEGKVININYQIDNNGKVSDFEKSEIFEKEKYSTLSQLLEENEINNKYFENVKPEISSLSPRNNFQTVESTIRIYGYTEPEINVTINDEILESDDEGYYSTQLELNPGQNTFELMFRDKFGNISIRKVTYTNKSANTTPTSFPVN